MEGVMAEIAQAQYPQSRSKASPMMDVFHSHEKKIDKNLFRIKISRF